MRALRLTAALVVALTVVRTPSVVAELSPEVYADLQRRAPEVLQLEITSADVTRSRIKRNGCAPLEREVLSRVTLTARVLAVTRSRAGLRPGRILRIEYESVERCRGWSGPRAVPVLRNGERVVAYLERDKRAYVPAARGASYEGVPK